jgi:hypothetical protein
MFDKKLQHYLMESLLLTCLAGCASSDIQMLLEYEGTKQLAKPDLVLIHDFIPPGEEDDPADQTPTPETLKKTETCREANEVIFDTLSEEMKKLGFPIQRAIDPIPAISNILTIEGEFLCLDEGNSFTRLLIGFGAGSAQVNTIVRIYLESGDQKELLQEFMATVETSDKAGIGPAVLGFDPMAGGGMVSTVVSCGMSAASETWESDIEALSNALAQTIVKSLMPLSIEHGWLGTPDDFVPPD